VIHRLELSIFYFSIARIQAKYPKRRFRNRLWYSGEKGFATYAWAIAEGDSLNLAECELHPTASTPPDKVPVNTAYVAKNCVRAIAESDDSLSRSGTRTRSPVSTSTDNRACRPTPHRPRVARVSPRAARSTLSHEWDSV